MTATTASELDEQTCDPPVDPTRPHAYIRHVTRVIHEINPHGGGRITVRGPDFIEHQPGVFAQAYALAYDHRLLHGFTSTDGTTVWTK